VRPDLGSVFTGPDADTEGDLDPDHRLVLKSSLPLLKSRNSGVVLAVCTLHYYCGTQSAVTTQQIAKALVRVLRNRREAQFVLLTCINTMARDRPAMFRPYLSDFFIKSTDPVFSRCDNRVRQ
jgi:AP-3 complex subunit beta